jgi:hypothetical protein
MQNRWPKYLVCNLFYDNVPVIRISAWSLPESEDASALFRFEDGSEEHFSKL